MLHEEVIKYRELSGDTNPNTPISRIGGYLDVYEKALDQEPCEDANANQHNSNELNDVGQRTNALEGDVISRQAAIVQLSHNKNGDDDCDVIIQKDIETIKALPPVTPQPNYGEWILVSERLPEEHLCDDGYVEPSDYVLVCGDHGNYGVSRYWGNRRTKSESRITYEDWPDLDWVAQKPIAWMPIRDPFDPKESEG